MTVLASGLDLVVLAADSGSDGGGGGGSSLTALLFPVLLIGLVYFGFIRPQRARARRAQRTADDIQPGRQVMTTAGLYGTVAAVEDDAILLEVAPGVTTRWARAAIAQVVPVPEALGVEEIGAEEIGETGDGFGADSSSDTSWDSGDDTRDGDDPKR